jgi:hypothetical protein
VLSLLVFCVSILSCARLVGWLFRFLVRLLLSHEIQLERKRKVLFIFMPGEAAWNLAARAAALFPCHGLADFSGGLCG